MKFTDNFIFELKYRPNKIKDIILPKKIKKHLLSIIEDKKLPNLLFSGSPGTGKTTVALAIPHQLELNSLYINMSKNTGIDTIRGQVEAFASTSSITGKKKVIIGDECDRLSPQAFDSLKGTIEEFSNNCTFIFTSNHKYKIPDPIISRLQEVDFIISKSEINDIKKQLFENIIKILKIESIQFEKKAIVKIVNSFFPDFRKCLNETQKLSMQGPITLTSVEENVATNINEYFKCIKSQNFTDLRSYISNISVDLKCFYSYIFRNLEKFISNESISEAIILLAKYQHESAFSIDPEITLTACSIEMMSLEYK